MSEQARKHNRKTAGTGGKGRRKNHRENWSRKASSSALPGAPGVNLSRSLRDPEERDALLAVAEDAMAGADPAVGLILRD